MRYQILTQFIKNMSSNNKNFFELITVKDEPNLNVDIRVNAEPLGEQIYESLLNVNVAVLLDEKKMFELNIDYAAIVKTEEENESLLKKGLLVKIPKLLFPYVRAIVSDITRDSGHPPLFLLPVDFDEMYEKNKK